MYVCITLLTGCFLHTHQLQGHFRIAEAYRDQSHVKRGGERLKLQICSIESFAKAFELRKESQAYFECLFLAVLTGTYMYVCVYTFCVFSVIYVRCESSSVCY